MDTLTLKLLMPVIALELIAVIVLLGATLLTQWRKTRGRVIRHREMWGRLFSAALAGDREALEQMQATLHSRADWKALHALVDEHLREPENPPTLRLRRLSRKLGLTERLHKQLLSARNPLDRAAAGGTLARLRERIAEDGVLDLLRAKDPAVVLAAAYATVCYRDPKSFLPVFRAVYGRTPITLHGAAELLSGLGEGVCPIITRLLKDAVARYQRPGADPDAKPDPQKAVLCTETATQVVMTDLLAFYAYRPAAPTVLQLLSFSTDDEVLIHLVKATAKIGDAGAGPRLTELLAHKNWVVRSQGALALAALGAVEAAPSISRLLDDDNASVRASALEALRDLEKTAMVHVEQPVEALA